MGSQSCEPDGCPSPIAIVGMSCRLPGGVSSSSEFWEFLAEGRSGQCDIPLDRFNASAFYHQKGLTRPGSMTTKGGYFLREDPRLFDHEFFDILPLEAMYMDPQQRKLLEVVYEAFENSGANLDAISGANVGCYVGSFAMDYQSIQNRDPDSFHRYVATGMSTSILGNRISHVFNLKGPSMVVDTACSSSLYSLHLACTALSNNECDAAVVAGANLILSPQQQIATVKAGILSPTSACHTFSEDADGYGRGEAVGCLFLKRLADAIANNDPIRAIVAGTAVNSNGRVPGITQPSAAGQASVIRKAYAKAGYRFDETSYVECHGTGTPVGDPIEVEGLSKVFSSSSNPMLLGAVKTNVGHSEAASGITAVMKTVLSLENGLIPATIGITKVNPNLGLGKWNAQIVRELKPWPTLSNIPSLRRAGVNSFGYGGANAHAILERREWQAPSDDVVNHSKERHQNWYLVPVSARSSESLEARIQQLDVYLSRTKKNVEDIAYTLSVRRRHFSHRTYFLMTQDGVHSALGTGEALSLSQKIASKEPSQMVFVFTGQGAQWTAMGAALYRQFPVFAAAIDVMDAQLRNLPHPPTRLLSDVICDEHNTEGIHDVAWSQPTCTAVQVALVILLRSWEILPSLVVGHSSGEIAAAFAAGFLSATQAITIAYYRGYAVKSFGRHNGAMMAVGLSPSNTQLEIEGSGLSDRLRIGCFNSPTSVTVSGDSDAIELLYGSLTEKRIFARNLLTNGRAYHSHHMKIVGAQYESLLLPFQNQCNGSVSITSAPRWISSVTGEEKVTAPDPAYWRANLESPTLFSQAMSKILSKKGVQVIEVGPHATLKVPINQTRDSLGLSPDSVLYTHTLSRNKNDASPILKMVGSLYIQGRSIAWEKVNSFHTASTRNCAPKVVLDLPPYPWRYGKIMWHESRESHEFRHRKHPRHELLGSLVPGGDSIHRLWRNELKLDDVPWLNDHKLEQTVVLPGAAYISMVLESANQIVDDFPRRPKFIQLEKVIILTALAIPEDRSIELFTALVPSKVTTSTFSAQQYDFQITSYEMGIATVRATGSVTLKDEDRNVGRAYEIPTDTMQLTQARVWYSRLREVGLQFGSAFQSIDKFGVPRARDKQLCHAQIRKLEDYDPDSEYILHPTVIDAMIQTALVATSCGRVRDLKPRVPVSFHSIVVEMPSGSIVTSSSGSITSVVRPVGFEASRFDAELVSSIGTPVCRIKEGKLVTYNPGNLDSSHVKRQPMLRVRWMPDVYGLGLISRPALEQYLQHTAGVSTSGSGNADIETLKAVVDLLTHKNPALSILQVQSSTVDAVKDLEAYVRPWLPDTSSCMTGFIDLAGDLYVSNTEVTASAGASAPPVIKAKNERFHLALMFFQDATDSVTEEKLATLKAVLDPRGMILCSGSSEIASRLERQGFEITYAGIDRHRSIVLGRLSRDQRAESAALSKLLYVVGRQECDTTAKFASHLARLSGERVVTLSFNDINQTSIAPGSTVYAFVEISEPLFPAISREDFERVKVITDFAAHLVWATSCNILSKPRPDFGLAFGLSRAVMMEQPATKFYVIDIDDMSAGCDLNKTFSNIISILDQDDKIDYEFVQSNGVVHVCRFVPDSKLNVRFQQIRGKIPEVKTLGSLGPARLRIGEAGMFDSLYFELVKNTTRLSPYEVRFTVKSVGLNAKDYYAFAGKVETEAATCTVEHAGVVEAVGPGVVDFAPGDRIVVMAPGHFQTSEVVPSWACQKLLDHEPFEVMCTLPVVFSTAIYALQDRARLQAGETVLIHSAAGGVGHAAVQIAQSLGATIFATVSTDEKAEHLSKKLGVPRENIFTSHNTSFLSGVLAATGGKGVDVVLNSLTGEALHASWKCCAAFGRFIEIGKQDINNYGMLDMQGFLQSKTFTAFDLSDIYYDGSVKCQNQWSKLLGEVLALFRSEKIRMIEATKVFNATEAADAMRHFASRNRIGKVVVNLDDPNSQVLTLPESFSTTFDEGKTYVMVGCLGGLGGSLSKWMVFRGARKFVFLGRSGLRKPAAKELIRDLELLGATCKVIQGDVCNKKDVDSAIAAVEGNIGGVVQAAMSLSEALFTAMGHDAWHEAVDPKLKGTWNLHHSLENRGDKLDFFLLMSSVSGSIGTATESNYCSASFFLDLFARYRRSQGLPATSIGLGMIAEVGYLHENPGIETILRRHGIHAMNEDEMLLICDLMLSKAHSEVANYDDLSSCHVLTGMETLGLQALRDDGFDVTNLNLDDPRASYLNRDFKGTNLSQVQGDHKALPAEIIAGLEDGRELSEVVVEHISRRFSTLVLLPVDKIDLAQPLSTYGMDSMIAAEFRTWFYQTFHLDIPFLDLLDSKATPISLAERVVEETFTSRDGNSGTQAQP